MQVVILHLPKWVEKQQLRTDLGDIFAQYKGKWLNRIHYPISYAVAQELVYKMPPQGTVSAFTNDLNVFAEEAPQAPGGTLWYTAKITFSGFDEESPLFHALRQSFEYLNNKYDRNNKYGWIL